MSERLLSGAEVSATTGYRPKFNTGRLNEWIKLVDDRISLPIMGVAGGMIVGTFGFFGLTVVGHALPVGMESAGSLLGAEFTASSVLGAGIGVLQQVRHQRLLARLLPVLSVRESLPLRTWLRERYAVEVDDRTADKLVAVVQGRLSGQDAAFHDAQGNMLKLECRAEEWFVEKDSTPKEQEWRPDGTVAASEAVSAAAIPAAADLLVGESRVLYDGILDTLKRLSAFPHLRPEHEHACARVREDLAEVLALMRRMYALAEPTAEQEQRVVQILSALMGELRELIVVQQADITRELRVQQAYLAARSPHAAGEAAAKLLRLPSATAAQEFLAADVLGGSALG